MSKKSFLICRIAVSFLLGIVVAVSVINGYWYVAVSAIFAAMLFLWTCRRKVKDVLADERDYQIAGKAARIAFSIFSLALAILGIIIISLGRGIEKYEYIANTMLYSSCALVFLCSILFTIYRKRGERQ